MPIASVARLIDVLRHAPFLEPSQLAETEGDLQDQYPEARDLARELVRRGWLTPFQANQVLQGRAAELVLGGYVLLERLGEGGMGQVFKARQVHLDRVVALKRVRPEHLGSPETVERFRREARTAARLAHPNIVHVYDAALVGDVFVLVMEYVEGTDLGKVVQKEGPLSAARVCDYVRQAALGLQHAHERGMVHRDVKPSNLLLTHADAAHPLGLVKLLDLGVARRTGEAEAAHTMTEAGSVIGTPDYVAPEQARDARKADARSDLYALGCAAYHLLTGRAPFAGGTSVEKLLNHQLDEPEPLERLRPDLPPPLAALVRKLLSKKPEDRHQTAAELAGELGALGAALSAPTIAIPVAVAVAHPLTRTALVDQTVTLRRAAAEQVALLSRRLLVGAAVAAVAMAGLAVAVASYSRTPAEDRPAETAPQPATAPAVPPAPQAEYVKKPTRAETVLATLRSAGLPTLEGKWYVLGPFDNTDRKAFDRKFAPETDGFDPTKKYAGKDGAEARWKEHPAFLPGRFVNLALFKQNHYACAYLHHEIECREEVTLPVAVASDDTLTLWLNGEKLLAKNEYPWTKPGRERVTLKLKPGTNRLLAKVGQGTGTWGFFVLPLFPKELDEKYGPWLRADFGEGVVPAPTLPPPPGRVEAAALKVAGKNSALEVVAMPRYLPFPVPAGAGKFFWAKAAKTGLWADFEVPAPADGKYRVYAYLARGQHLATVQFRANGKPLGKPVDCYAPEEAVHVEAAELGVVGAAKGKVTLRVEAAGRNEKAPANRPPLKFFFWGLDSVVLEPVGP